MDKILIHRAGVLEREVELQPVSSIGRHRQNTIQLEDPQISRIHAILTRTEAGYVLEDQGSMNGTFVNDKKLERKESVQIVDGDRIRMESFELLVALEKKAELETVKVASGDASALKAELEKAPESNILLSHLLEERGNIPVWSTGEIELEVADIIDETGDAKTFRLKGKEAMLFSYKPGQFITLSVDIDGKTVKRSYSISSCPSRPHTIELTIKRVPGGLVSNWLSDNLKLGDTLKVRGPAGKFSCFNYPSRKMLCIAGGSGITPIMSMLRWIVDTAADVDVILLYSVRSPTDIIFRKELEYISARHSGFRVFITVTSRWVGTESWTGLSCRVDAKMIDLVAPDLLDRHVFMCGPKPFGDAVKDQLKKLDYPTANLHTESFGSGRVAKGTRVEARDVPKPAPAAKPAPKPAVAAATPAAAPKPAAAPTPEPEPVAAPAGFAVEFKSSGVKVTTAADDSLLDLAEVNGVDIDYACRTGSCGTCRTRCLAGTVDMEDNDLSDDDRKEGWIYVCVSRPTSDVVLEA